MTKRAARSVTAFAVHPGLYKDSLVLMQLQNRLLAQPGVLEAAAAMASQANLDLLDAAGLLPAVATEFRPEDLLVVVRADTQDATDHALASVGELLGTGAAASSSAYRPHSLDGALSQLPDARWVLVSVPGPHAPRVTEEALDRNLNVFLYSDNVATGEEVRLKKLALSRGLMVLGPDCGTAVIAGTGLGFANRVRRGSIGLVGGSGTGLQAVSVQIHRCGGGISQAIGTGGRDLSEEVGGLTTRQGLRALADDPETAVIVLISKSPGERVARRAYGWASNCGKPVVVYFQGLEATDGGSLHVVSSLTEAAAQAVRLSTGSSGGFGEAHPHEAPTPPTTGYVRGLFAGGTLAAEALLQLRRRVAPLHSNISGDWRRLADPARSREHTIVDLGADEFTQGRLHPMIDQEARLSRLRLEASDGDVSVILLDVVLGEGAHADPAAELAPVIEEIQRRALEGGRVLHTVVILIGTEEDPQDFDSQRDRLTAAGAIVVECVEDAVAWVPVTVEPEEDTTPLLRPGDRSSSEAAGPEEPVAARLEPLHPGAFIRPVSAVNIGLESFHSSLLHQGARAVHVVWRPPAGGKEHLAGILDRLRVAGRRVTETSSP